MRPLPSRPEFRSRLAMVPSIAINGMEAIRSEAKGLFQACCKICAPWRAVIRPSRVRPAPFSITRPAVLTPFSCSHSLTTRIPATRSSSSSSRRFSAPMVRSNWRAITLLLHLLMSLTIVTRSGDVVLSNMRASSGVLASRLLPLMSIPMSDSSERIMDAVYCS